VGAPGEVVIWGDEAPSLLGWTSQAAEGSSAELAVEPNGALRFDFTLSGPTSWAIARRELRAALPGHYVAHLRLRGSADPQELQVKLVDSGGRNVWWWRERGFTFSGELQDRVLRKAGLAFAWGPAGGGDPAQIGAVELAVAPGSGGRGTLFVERLCIEPRSAPAPLPRAPALRASSSAPGHEPERALESDDHTCWRPAVGDTDPWLELDLGRSFEWGGLSVELEAGQPACRLLGSLDGERWDLLAQTPAGRPGPHWLRTPSDVRFARVALDATPRAGIRHLGLVPLEHALAPARHAASLARRAPRGAFPRHLLGEQAAWCVVGADGDDRKGLLGEDGALEVSAESFSVEPFLWTEGRLLSWADVTTTPSLASGSLPIPTVEWEAEGLRLRITTWATEPAGASALVARYELANPGARRRDVRLLLALRPFQVTPVWQGLGFDAGFAPLTSIERRGGALRVNGAWNVIPVSRPDAFGVLRSADGSLAALLAAGGVPPRARADDALGLAEAVLAFDVALLPGASRVLGVAIPLHPATAAPPAELAPDEAAAWLDARLAETEDFWRTRLGVLPFALPPCAASFEASARASLAWLLVNREGPRIQAGPRAYRRSWIRDGAFAVSALTELGFPDEARAFLRWYAPHQLANGRVPCAVDRRGVDPVPEHDSHGQLIWASVEVWRLTGDRAFLAELWPRLLRAADAIAALRTQRTGPERRGEPSYGLLPESISHEGYSSQPVHSYWDDFFALRGLADAADAAAALGELAQAERIGGLSDAFRADLRTSLERSMARHGIDFLPGSVELGDFDPTSTAAAIDPCGEGALLPRAALERTFERYLEELAARREHPPESYAPYEVRNATALIWLGRKPEALELLARLLADQRPPAWRQWPEIVWRDPRAPRFLGDLPHGWIAATFARSVRRLLALEREDGALVLAPGIPEAWVREEPGVRVRGLPTHFGPLSYTLRADGEARVRLALGPGLRPPPGGLVVESPCARPLRAAEVDGRRQASGDPRRVQLAALPAEVILHY
jgi:hypothetical protein